MCPHRRCKRARACRDADPARLPFCYWQHQGSVRFFLAVAAAQRSKAPGAPKPKGLSETPPPPGETLVGQLAAVGVPIPPHRPQGR